MTTSRTNAIGAEIDSRRRWPDNHFIVPTLEKHHIVSACVPSAYCKSPPVVSGIAIASDPKAFSI